MESLVGVVLASNNNNWKSYRFSINFVERQTGFDFFSNLTASVHNVIEARIDNQ